MEELEAMEGERNFRAGEECGIALPATCQPVFPDIHLEGFSPAQLIIQISLLQAPHPEKQRLAEIAGRMEMGNQTTLAKIVRAMPRTVQHFAFLQAAAEGFPRPTSFFLRDPRSRTLTPG